ncbi:orotidine 5'-phosphate decarboxylase [Insulibacter thermoxylanivorax]|uniref:Orotidine 5'-phosphate decarboxylase n=1 Tax=Insulibacter thermoxylanivorax TaxID=2749268 RepID=A0A916QDC8_9BACL|nr:orotidine 5'-phosphate decarboxylase [Insulibacter thermoxylanivorax]
MQITAAASRLMVALDYPNAAAAERLLTELKGIPCYMKVGMQLFYAAGPAFIERLQRDGYRVFLDLKMHDIPNTVKGAAQSIASMGVDMFNVHAAGGVKMMEAALAGAALAGTAAKEAGSTPEQPLVIAVTQLTSTDQRVLNEEIGIQGTVEDAVVHYARLARLAGLHGVVASPLEVKRIKETCDASFITVTPGIRPQGAERGDQSRVMTPGEAIRQGTDYIVVGRPITAAPSPRQAAEAILAEMAEALAELSSR